MCNKSIGLYIFGGSQTCGHLNTGWNVDRILEMTDDMPKQNSYHFIKNYPDIPVVIPSKWNSDTYLDDLVKEDYDLLFANNPCSGLSSINKNNNVNQPINNKFFEVFDVIDKLNPKTFLIENAPTLVTIGTPILQKMVEQLKDKYKFTIIRDMAANHNVCMKRTRTLICGWRKDIFENKIPLLHMNKQKHVTINEVIKKPDNIDKEYNLEFVDDTRYINLIKYYDLVPQNSSILRTMYYHFDEMKNDLNDRQLHEVETVKRKFNENKNIWDKSPWRIPGDSYCPSIASVSRYIHPKENRDLYIREYARLMGYPEDFIFYPDECEVSTIQCIAQGVPVKFIEYISNEIKQALDNKREYIVADNNVIYQNHIANKYYILFDEVFFKLDSLNKGVTNVIKGKDLIN